MIKIRAGNIMDVSSLQNLNNEVFIDNAKYDEDIIQNWATGEGGKRYFTDLFLQENSLCLIAEEDNKSIGYLVARHKQIDYRKSRYLEIENMGVNPEHRGKGIGNLLLLECAKWAKKHNYQKLFVNAYTENKNAINFYKKNSFVEIDISLESII